ncbi:protein kinase domain containing protein [Babesia bovis T2Bo]|uniref:protein kinase domain containing protein n=1 Tax=Babesia bovis T2Bo TaxID=484906 RepID=UPI001C3478BF|nr:protein kinase domain containing protein [Babesia bovis T2Bo]EDO05129.2 protein kinase domain containing protein [Babesia bovis T2Bo]
MARFGCLGRLCSRKPLCYRYFVLSTIERKTRCKIFLAFRVPASSTSVDYTIGNAEILLQNGFRLREGELVADISERLKRGYVNLDGEGSRVLDHYASNGMLCILKRYHRPEDAVSIHFEQRCSNEITSVQKLRKSKHVVTFLETFDYDGFTYFAMEYLWRGSLWSLIRRVDALDLDTAKSFALQLANAIGDMHSKSIAHRDLTSSNIMIGPGGQLKIIDFNLCKPIACGDHRMHSFVGTYCSMPPEVLLCNPEITSPEANAYYGREVDWWYFGSLLYEMLTGKRPFITDDGASGSEFYNTVARSPSSIDFSGIKDAAARDLVERLLNAVPSERLGSTGGVKAVTQHQFFKGVDTQLSSISTVTDFIDARVFECIKVIISDDKDP